MTDRDAVRFKEFLNSELDLPEMIEDINEQRKDAQQKFEDLELISDILSNCYKRGGDRATIVETLLRVVNRVKIEEQNKYVRFNAKQTIRRYDRDYN